MKMSIVRLSRLSIEGNSLLNSSLETIRVSLFIGTGYLQIWSFWSVVCDSGGKRTCF